MENEIICRYNDRMKLCDYLAVQNHYLELFRAGEYEARRRLVFQPEEADDIVSEALEKLLDYFCRKPEKLFLLESMEAEKMKNYLKKAMRHQVINISKQRNRWFTLRMEDMPFVAVENSSSGYFSETKRISAAETSASFSTWSLSKLKDDLHFFIEEKFGREKWQIKKEAVDLFVERVENNMRIGDLQAKHPDKNIAVLNTIAHRIVKKYSCWVQKNSRNHSVPDEGHKGR